MNRYISTHQDVERLPLRNSTVTQVRVGAHHVDLILQLEAGSANAEIRIESRGTITKDGGAVCHDAGPDLGAEALQLIDAEVTGVGSDGLDLVLTFVGDRGLAVHVDSSGFESYSVRVAGGVWVAIGGVES